MENMKPFNEMSEIVWDFHLCYNINVSLFNDEKKKKQRLNALIVIINRRKPP